MNDIARICLNKDGQKNRSDIVTLALEGHSYEATP